MDVLHRIKRLLLRGKSRFSWKAAQEMRVDELEKADVIEAVLNAHGVSKVLRSRNPRDQTSERLYVIKGFTHDGTEIYTKGKITREDEEEFFYFFISSKRSTFGN